ncbi:MAG TPA: hypothetical protein VGJ05_03390 [Fimbriiglobus sp.]|jgi:hypothetical protein
MPTFLSDPSPAFTFVLLLVAVIAIGVWYRFRDKTSRNRMIAILIVVGALLVIGQAFDSPREIAEKKVQAMVAAATKSDPDAFLKNVSDSFVAYGANKAKLRTSPAWDLIKQYKAEVIAYDFPRNLYKEISPNEIEIAFTAKAKAESGFQMRYCLSRFVKDPDGEWRMKGIKFYNMAEGGMNREDPIPGFP